GLAAVLLRRKSLFQGEDPWPLFGLSLPAPKRACGNVARNSSVCQVRYSGTCKSRYRRPSPAVPDLSFLVHVILYGSGYRLPGMAPAERGPRSAEPLVPPVDGGLRGMAPEQVARHQRARLEAALVEAVSRYGYAGTTLRELVRLAGVSKSTFYDHFENKQEAF